MKSSLRRLVLALAASIFFHVIVILTGVGADTLIGSVFAAIMMTFNLAPHDAVGFLAMVLSSLSFYTIVFWTVGTIWRMSRDAWG